MILHPTVVIGVGSTGKHVVANAQKYLYEEMNVEGLGLFKFIVLETATNKQDQGWADASNTKLVNIKVQDIGATYFTLKQNLGNDFNWCPSGMQIIGPGAGNKRAGGRLMLFHHMQTIQEIIQTAISDVRAAAIDDHTTRVINQLLKARGVNEQEHPLPSSPVPVVLVVGTLTGGTCSGTCVDLGYLLRRIAPGSDREAIFFLPDNGAVGTYKANAWAALSDLVYFTEHPSDYEAVWLNRALSRSSHEEGAQLGPVPPYKHVYLVTQRDRAGNEHLPYRDDPDSPLLRMGGLCVVANLLGLYELRQTRLVDLNVRVGENAVHNTFLTQSVRGVSYPKYEISEAAACKIIADHICEHWLSRQACWDQGRREGFQREETNKLGREFWNTKCPPIWDGLRRNVDLVSLARRIKSGQIIRVADYLKTQITDNRDGTIIRAIDQNVENCRRELQYAIRSAFIEALQRKQNVQYAEWFLDGVQEEINRTRKYWEAIGIPTGDNDMPAWQAKAGNLVERHVVRHTGISVNMLGQRLSVIEDELQQMVVRLEMFLMHKSFSEISRWVNAELHTLANSIRTLLTDVRPYVLSKGDLIAKSLQDRSGPLLKVSRSEGNGFADEITDLAKSLPSISGKDFVDYEDGNFTGMFCLTGHAEGSAKGRLFEELIERIQPALIYQLEKGGSIDIVTEIERQHICPQVAQRAHETQVLSLSTRHELMIGEYNVPSLLLTKSILSSNRLEQLLRKSDAAFPILHKDELPLFDHLALFYQEGGKFNLDSLLYGDDLKRSFDEVRKADESITDPLRSLKKHSIEGAKSEPWREA